MFHVPSGCLSPLNLLYKQSLNLGLITCSDGNLESLTHYGLFVLALTGCLEIVAMPVQSSLRSEKTFFLRPYLPDPL